MTRIRECTDFFNACRSFMGPSMFLGSASVQNLSFTLVQELSRLLYAPIHLLNLVRVPSPAVLSM